MVTAPRPTSARRRLEGAEALVAMLGFPGLLCAGLAAFMMLVGRGVDANAASLVVIAVSYALIEVAERLMPWQRTWLHSQGDLRTDVGLFVTNGLVGGVLSPLLLVAVAELGAALSARVGMGL